MKQEYKNILVNSLVNIGDVLLTTSAVALLRQAYPNSRITMMVRPVAAELIRDHPVIDEVLVYDYKGRQRRLKSQFKFMQDIRRRRFDLVVSFDRKLRPAILSFAAGIPVRVVPDRVFDDVPSWVTKLYTHVVPIPFDLPNHLQADTYQEIVRRFTGLSGQTSPILGKITAEHCRKVDELLGELPPARYKIALCVKGTFALKNWPADRFAALIERLNDELDAAFYVIGASEDREYAAAVIEQIGVAVHNFCGLTTLRELAALMEKTDLFITVDTGATHVAATTGVPTVVMYGCTTPRRWRPYNDHVITLSREPDCCPCKIAEDECGMEKCLGSIGVDEVYQAALSLVKKR